MDHAHIEDQLIVDRYVADRLSSEERRDFEQHFLDCPSCQEALELALDLREGLCEEASASSAGAEPKPPPEPPPKLLRGPWAWASRPPVLPLLAAASLLLVAGFLVFQHRAILGQRAEIDSLAEAVEQRQRTIDALRREASPPRPDPEVARLRETLEARDASRRRLESELDGLRRRLERASARLSEALRPQANVDILLMTPVRGGEVVPEYQVSWGSGPRPILLEIDMHDQVRDRSAATYRARVEPASGGEPLEVDGLEVNLDGALTLHLPAGSLEPGTHSVTLETSDDGRTVARFSLVVRSRA